MTNRLVGTCRRDCGHGCVRSFGCGVRRRWRSQVLTAVAAAADDPFTKCAEQFARKPDDYESAYCFYEVTLQKSLWEDGARVFDGLIEQHPANLWLPLAYGHVYRSRDPGRAEALYRKSADGFQRRATPKARSWPAAISGTSSFQKAGVADATRETERVAELGRSVERSAAQSARVDARGHTCSGHRRRPQPRLSPPEADRSQDLS